MCTAPTLSIVPCWYCAAAAAAAVYRTFTTMDDGTSSRAITHMDTTNSINEDLILTKEISSLRFT